MTPDQPDPPPASALADGPPASALADGPPASALADAAAAELAASTEIKRAIEAIVLVADEPVPTNLLAQLLEVSPARVDRLCDQLADEYRAEQRGFFLCRVAGGYRYQTHHDLAPYVERFVLEGQSSRMSAAALETLAIVAYKQPISRNQITAIRGVNADGVVRTLQQRGYIADVGRDPGPGNAVLLGTTPMFLERLGLDSVADLPALIDFVPGADVVEALEAGLRPSDIDLRDLPSEESSDDPNDEAGGDATGDTTGDTTDDAPSAG